MPLAIALALGLLVAVAEVLHARKVARIARLAFGPTGTPAAWATLAPIVRSVGVASATWGAVVLSQWDPVEAETTPNPRASRQLLIVLDVSPSMQIKDAGPDAEKITRAQWAGKVTQGILDRLDMKDTRITLVAFYTKALPVLQDSTDKNVVANLLDGLPMHVAFEPGTTDLSAGLNEAFRLAKPWARRSATLLIITDGDLESHPSPTAVPASIADTIVLGVGDPAKATLMNGHSSRQDVWTLKQLAARLNASYHEGNRLHLPSSVLDRLTMMSPRVANLLSLREAGLLALAVGASLVGLVGPALLLFGIPRDFARARRELDRRTQDRTLASNVTALKPATRTPWARDPDARAAPTHTPLASR